jgi:hypothetical protein
MISIEAMKVALVVVAEASSDVLFAPFQDNVGSKGPINTSQSISNGMDMAASYVNANSIMDVDGPDDTNESGDLVQKSVVAAWLLVKESSVMISTLVEISPPPGCVETQCFTVYPELLTENDIQNAGYVVLDALSRLKHMGAIAEAHSSLQSIVSNLLRFTFFSISDVIIFCY